MEIRAYDEVYLTQAQRILGDMMDFAVNSCDMDPDEYFRLFLASPISTQFENGNPAYVSGKTGCEIVKETAQDTEGDVTAGTVCIFGGAASANTAV